jgi:hypothetical protein
MHDGIADPRLLFMTDEACLHISGHVNAQNVGIWSDENPHLKQQVPLHSEIFWCGVLCCAVLCCAVLCCAVLCCAVLCCAVSPR